MRPRFALFIFVIFIALTLPACVKPTALTQTTQPAVLETPATPPGDLVVSNASAFIDNLGTYRVTGLVLNNSSKVINSIELTIEIKDAAGNSLLMDDNGIIEPASTFYPMLYTLAPGEASPFEFSYDTSTGTPATFNVVISGQGTGNTDRAVLQWENVQLVDNGLGLYYLTGKIINTGSRWAHIQGLAGGVLDDSNNLLSANLATTYTTELAPAGDPNGFDRTPFEITFPIPGGSTKWQLYLDADATDIVTNYPLEMKITSTYFDQEGSANIVGWVTNNSTQTLMVSHMVGGLYAGDGTVLDAGNSIVPVPVKPGESAPFSISEFGLVNHDSNQIALVQTCSAQYDPYFTFPSSFESVDLTAVPDPIQQDNATWIFSGTVTNSSGRNLSGITVTAMIMDSQNKLVAMGYTSIIPTADAISADESNTYYITINMDPSADATSYSSQIKVIGYLK
jgi:hypothetical protein